MINVYSDTNQTALKYLKDTAANIWNVLVIAGDFNIRDSIWDSLIFFYSIHSNLLTNIVSELWSLDLSFF